MIFTMNNAGPCLRAFLKASSHAVSKKLVILGLVLAVLSGCASTGPSVFEPSAAEKSAKADTASVNVDPYEGFNRTVYGFNNGIDTYFLKPVSQGYQYVTPDVVETGVSNFFANLLEIRNALNAALQGKGGDTLNYTGRFLFNSTIGLAGLLDVASEAGIEKKGGEDFGQTLGAWGVASGPYLVLPFLGPSTVRDGVGIPVDMYMDPVNYAEESSTKTGLTFLELVDTRAKLLETEKLVSGGDRYLFIRDAYLQRRDYLVNDGDVSDSFGDGLEGDF